MTAAPAATSEAVRRSMLANRPRDTAPERRLRSELHRLGLRFRKHRRIPAAGRARAVEADACFPRERVAVFLDGCFWHGCPEHGSAPKANAGYWGPKLARCGHSVGGQVADSKNPGAIKSGVRPGADASRCRRCGARRVDRQIGLERTPDEWAARLVAVFREARRVLRDDGTLWVECGDSYAAAVPYYAPDGMNERTSASRAKGSRPPVPDGMKEKDLVLAPMLLAVMLRADGWVLRGVYVWEKPDAMPESVEDRCTVSHSHVLHLAKGNRPTYWTHRDGRGARSRPGPDWRWVDKETGEESAEPREGERWGRINLWRGRDYYFDRDAIREPFSDYSGGGDGGSFGAAADDVRVWEGGSRGTGFHLRRRPRASGNLARKHGADVGRPGATAGDLGRSIPWAPPDEPNAQLDLDGNEAAPEERGPDGRRAFHLEAGENSLQHRDGSRWPSLEGRSPRSVWRIATEASSFGLCPVCRTYWERRAPRRHCGADVIAHFAVWPHALVGKIIAASTSEHGCCAECGAPWARHIAKGRFDRSGDRVYGGSLGQNPSGTVPGSNTRGMPDGEPVDLGWHPTCDCRAGVAPCVVLDPFGGSATTARQARAMGRAAVIIELNPDYAEIAARRTAQQGLLSTA